MNSILVIAALGFAITAAANNPAHPPKPAGNSSADSSSNNGDTILDELVSEIKLPDSIRVPTGYPSSTAIKYYRIGVRAYEKNDLERAETAFNSALRAHSRALKPNIILYLSKIAEQNGEIDKAFLYGFVYIQLAQPDDPILEALEDPDLEFRK